MQFLSIDDARATIEAWRIDYNAHRPHCSLGNLTPSGFARKRQGNRTSEVADLWQQAVQERGQGHTGLDSKSPHYSKQGGRRDSYKCLEKMIKN